VLEAKAYSKDPSDPQRELLAVTTRSYDSIDNVLSELQRIEEDRGQGFSQIHSADLSMTFDGLKNRLSVASSLGGYSASYDFDPLSRIERIGYLATYEQREYMGAAGRLFAKHNGNNTTTELGALGYDSLRRPIRITHKRNDSPNPTTLADFHYDYDINSNRLSEAKQHYTGQDQAYAYDEVNRLVRFDEGFLVGNVIPNPIDTEVYGLDGVGNRKQHEKNGQLFTNTVDSMNRYAASYNGNLALDYDPRGNTTQYGDLNLTYDVYGKVVGADGPAITAVYLYDASGRRVMSQVNGYATYFVLEGDRVLQEVDGNSAQVTKEYVWGSAIDELVILQLDGEIYHAHADALGSTALLTDANGDVVERYDYNPFGACVASDVNGGGLVGNPYRFTGRRLDSETGLYYYRARHYSTEMGRFLSPDPIGPWKDAGNFGNGYAYIGNNPFRGTDPTGKRDDWFTTVEKVPNDPTGNKRITSLGGHTYEFDITQGPGLFEATACIASHPLVTAGTNILASIVVPGYGEAQDASVIADPNSAGWEKTLSGASLTYSGYTLGLGPNLGSIIKSADDLVEGVADLFNTGRKLEKTTDGLKTVDAGKSAGNASNAAEKTARAGAKGGSLRSRMGDPPSGMTKPQAHHDLPQKFKGQFEKVGLDINDPKYGRWVEGGKAGNHQKWSQEFNKEWENFFRENKDYSKEDILDQMTKLGNDERFQ